MILRPIFAFALLAAGCNTPASDQNDAVAEPASVDVAVNDVAPIENQAAVPEPAAFPEEIILSTNEPFWQARIGAESLVLTGAGQEERRLAIIQSSTGEQGLHVVARDAVGTVEAIVRELPCEDSMSGAHFPYSGSLAINGAPANGCARPASDPQPVASDQ